MSFCRIALCLCVVMILGCVDSGPAKGIVKGRVTIGGAAPTETIRVNFINSIVGQGGGATAGADGSYVLDQALQIGEYTVYLEKVVDSSGPVSTEQEALKSVPEEYRTEASSPLKKIVNEGANTINLELPAAE
jgi:hypothetical protein